MLSGRLAPAKRRRSRLSRLPVLAKVGILFVVLVVAGTVSQASVPGTPTCVYACHAPVGPLVPAAASYTSPQGFTVSYPSALAKQSAALGSELRLGNPNTGGQLLVWSGTGQQQAAGLVQAYAQKLQPLFQNFNAYEPLPAPEVGFVPAEGELYCAYVDTGGQEVPALVVVVAVQSANTWAVLAGYTGLATAPESRNTYCGSKNANTPVDAGDIDDVLARWQWGAPAQG